MTLSQHSAFHQAANLEWQRILDPGEPLLWQGRPDAGVNFTLSHLTRLVRSAVMLSLFVYLVHSVGYGIANSVQVRVIVALVFFLPVPLDLIKSMITRRMQIYALTPTRAVIITSLRPFGRSIRSIPITATTPVTFLRGAYASILFAEQARWYSGLITPPQPAGLERIGGAKAVLAIIRQNQLEAV